MSERMAEERTAEERVEQPSPAAHPHVGPASPSIKIGSQSFRFDGPEMTSAPDSSPGPLPTSLDPTAFSDKAAAFGEFIELAVQAKQQIAEIGRREQHLTQHKTEFEHEQRQFRLWASDKEAELAERLAVQTASETALVQRMAEFDQRERRLEADAVRLEAERVAWEQERALQRQDLQRDLERDRQALTLEKQTLSLQQAKVQELGDALMQQHASQQADIQQQLQREREQLWVTLNAEWEDKRNQFEREKTEYLKDRTLLDNRIRFHQDYLEKTRAELDQHQQDVLHEQQATRQRLEAAEQQLLRRTEQLNRYRESLEELERALERESDLITRFQASISSAAAQDQQHYLEERRSWDDERRQQQAELRRQQELLLTHTEGLETRRLRLESLRREVEETNHTTLELRLAVEEVWAQLQQSLGMSATQDAVAAARQAVHRDYEQWQARLAEQRRELYDLERHFEQQRLAFQEERRTLTEWIAARDEELLRKAQMQHQQTAEQRAADRSWQDLRDRWLAERAEAERVIRRLLHDLVVRTAELPEPDASALATSDPA